jgi:serine protease Do
VFPEAPFVFRLCRFSHRLLAAVAACVVLPLLAVACGAPAAAQTHAQQAEHVRRLQYLLLWSGDYLGQLDGRPGALLSHALRSYQRKAGFRRADTVDAAQLRHLSELAQRAMRQLDYGYQTDLDGGGRLALPRTLFTQRSATGMGVLYHTTDNAFEVETVRQSSDTPTFLELYRSSARVFDADSLITNIFGGDSFIISGQTADRIHSARFEEHGNEIRGIKIRFRRDADPKYVWLAKAMLQDFVPFGESMPIGLPPSLHEIRMALRPPSDPERFSNSSGSGFVVSTHGHVMTNAHVVLLCDDIRVGDNKPAKLIAVQAGDDLALLQVPDLAAQRVADFASAEVLLGEDVAVFGYPLRPLLAAQLNMTTGIVSSLRGLGGDPAYIQISASVQPGNSGGPVVDLKGRVVGIATSVLNTARSTHRPDGTHAPINFAIRHERMLRFLRAQGIQPKTTTNTEVLAKTDLAAQAAAYTVSITCERR